MEKLKFGIAIIKNKTSQNILVIQHNIYMTVVKDIM